MQRNYTLTADVTKDTVRFFIIRDGGDYIFETNDGDRGTFTNLTTKLKLDNLYQEDAVELINHDLEIVNGDLYKDLQEAFTALQDYRESAKISEATIAVNVERLIRR